MRGAHSVNQPINKLRGTVYRADLPLFGDITHHF